MQIAFRNHINKNLPFLKDKNLLIAVSGGIDSVVLTHLLKKLKFRFELAHCNFKLRGKESNKDEQFVLSLAKKINVPSHTIQFETESYAREKSISTQMAARELRYNWFQELCLKNSLDYILTAHHKEDIFETVLMNLTRGTGLDGLTGIPEMNGNIIRPMLPFTRNDIIVYASRNKIQWREDQSNSSIKYARNKIRHKVVPVLKELNPNLLSTFDQTLDHLKGSKRMLEDHIERVFRKTSIIKAGQMRIRPVLLTTITTVGGLSTVAYGIGGKDPFLVPMALSICWGIAFATVLTLIVIPCIYSIVDDISIKITKHSSMIECAKLNNCPKN